MPEKSKADKFESFIAPYERGIYFTCLRILCHVQDAEDCAQDCILKAYRSFDSFRGDSEPSTWLYRIAYNCCVDYIKKRKGVVSLDALIDEGADFEDESDDISPYLSLEESERKRLLIEALSELPYIFRFPIVLCDLRGIDYDKAAQIMDIPLGTLKSRLNRARKKLKKILIKNRELFLSDDSLIDEGREINEL